MVSPEDWIANDRYIMGIVPCPASGVSLIIDSVSVSRIGVPASALYDAGVNAGIRLLFTFHATAGIVVFYSVIIQTIMQQNKIRYRMQKYTRFYLLFGLTGRKWHMV